MESTITAKFSGFCRGCGGHFPSGTQIIWVGSKESYHEDCWKKKSEGQPAPKDEGGEDITSKAASLLRGLKLYQLRAICRALLIRSPGATYTMVLTSLTNYALRNFARLQEAVQKVRALRGSDAPTPASVNKDQLQGIVQDILAEKVEQIVSDSLPEKDEVIALIKQLVEEMLPKVAPRQIEIKDEVGINKLKGFTLPACFERMVKLAASRVHILMVGPSGSGKTFLAERLAEAIRTKAHPKGLPFYGVSCSVGMSESQLSGYLLPSGKGGQFEYWSSLFVKAYTEGGLFLFDEMDAADSNTLTFINAALANSHMFVSQKITGQVVTRHPDFVCVAAANTWGFGADDMFVGRNQLDAATLRRFNVGLVKVDYDETVEKAIINDTILEYGLKVRSTIRQHRIKKTMSTGEMLDASKLLKAYEWSPKECFQGYFLNWTPDELGRLPEEVR